MTELDPADVLEVVAAIRARQAKLDDELVRAVRIARSLGVGYGGLTGALGLSRAGVQGFCKRHGL